MQSQLRAAVAPLPKSVECLIMSGLVAIVAFCTYSVSKQRNPENATLAQLREAGSIKVVIYDPHHKHRRKPSPECPDRHFIALVPKIKGMRAVLTVSKIAWSEGHDLVLRELDKPWQWDKDTELRNERLVIQAIGIRDFTPGTYRAKLTVEKNSEKITVAAKGLLTIPNREKPTPPVLSGFARRTAVRRFC